MKHLEELLHFLGIDEVRRYSIGIFLSQTKYANDILAKTSMLGCKPCGSPCSYKSGSSATQSPLLSDPTSYRRITGALQYLTLTRPDLLFAVNLACQHMHQPTEANFVALKHFLRYIKGTLSHAYFYSVVLFSSLFSQMLIGPGIPLIAAQLPGIVCS